MCGFKLDAFFSDVFGKSSTRIHDKLLECGGSGFDAAPLIHGRRKASLEEIQAAPDGGFSLAQAEKLKIIRRHMEAIDKPKDLLESLILKLAEQFQPQIDLLPGVPGIGSPLTTIRILAEIEADMSVFETSKRLCSRAGLSPQNNGSANKRNTTRISRAGTYLKPLLVQIVLAICKSGKHPKPKDKYHAIKKRRGYKKAVIAISRKILTAIWHMFGNGEFYNAELYHKADKPPVERVPASEQAFAPLRGKGHQIVETEPAA